MAPPHHWGVYRIGDSENSPGGHRVATALWSTGDITVAVPDGGVGASGKFGITGVGQGSMVIRADYPGFSADYGLNVY